MRALGRDHLGLVALLAVYFVVTLTYGFLNPLGEGPDEVANIELIQFISRQGHLPRTFAEREAAGYKSDWPMLLYHAPLGMATRWIDYNTLPGLKVLDNHLPRRLLVEDDLARFALVHTDDEAFPFQGVVLQWHLARLVSTLFTAGTLIVVYAIALTVRPGDRMLALGATAAAAAIPEFHFTASVAHEDNVMGLFAALFTLTLLRTWQRPAPYRTYAWLGLWFGLALTAKYSVGLMPLLVLVVLLAAVRRRELSRRAALYRLILFLLIMALVAMWWFVYVEWYFNQIEELGLLPGLLKPLMASGIDVSMRRVAAFLTAGAISGPGEPAASAWSPLVDWVLILSRPFWFIKWPASAPLMTAMSLSFLGLCCLAALGLARAWRRREELAWPSLGLLALQIGLLLPFPWLRLYLTGDPIITAQARHLLFPAAAAIGLLLTMGVAAWLPPTYRRLAGLGLAAILLSASLLSFFGYVLPLFPPRLPVRTSADALEGVPHPLGHSFENGIELAGYQVGETNRYGALPVTLVWHSLAYTDHDYLVEVSLLGQKGETRRVWVGHPVNGRYPTRAWDPGDVVRDTVWLPLAGVTAGEYRLQVQLLSSFDMKSPGRAEETAFVLPATYSLPSPSPSGQPALFSPTVWHAGQPAAGLPTYHYRASIPITVPESLIANLDSQIPNPVTLLGPDGIERSPLMHADNTYIFLVGADWPSGAYRMRSSGSGETVESGPLLRVQLRPRSFAAPSMTHEVRANFGDEIMLLGYDFPQRRARPGEVLPITLYWQALRPVARDYVVSNHLLSRGDLRQWGGEDRIPHYYYSPILWAPGEVVRDDYWVPVDPLAPPGIYFLDIGLYVELVGQSWHLPLVRDGATLEADSVSISPIKVGGPPPGVTVDQPAPQHPRADNLGGMVTLLGYDLTREAAALNVTLYWRCDAPLPADYTTFVHVRAASDQVREQPDGIVAQMDRPPADGAYPTSLWEPGEIIRDAVRVPAPAQVPPGEYEIITGLYDLETNSRLPVLDARGQPVGDSIRLEERITVMK